MPAELTVKEGEATLGRFLLRWLLLFGVGEALLLVPVVPMVVADYIFFGDLGRLAMWSLFFPFVLWSFMCLSLGWIFVALRKQIFQARFPFFRRGFILPLCAPLLPAGLFFILVNSFEPVHWSIPLFYAVLIQALGVVFVCVTSVAYMIAARLTGLMDWT